MPNFEMIPYQKTENVISDLKNIIEVAQKQAYHDYFSRSAPLIHSLSTISKYSIYG